MYSQTVRVGNLSPEGFGRGYYKTVMSTVRTKPIKGRKTFSLVVDRENVMVTSRYGLTLHVRTFKNSDLARSYFHLADGHMHSVNEAIDTITAMAKAVMGHDWADSYPISSTVENGRLNILTNFGYKVSVPAVMCPTTGRCLK